MKVKQIALLLFLFFTASIFATEQTNAIENQALVEIKIGIELSKLESSAMKIEQSVKLASLALQEMAKDPNISDQQQAKVIATLEHIDVLSKTLQTTIKEIPTTITQSAPPILSAVNSLFSNIQLTVLLVLIAIFVLLLGAVIAIYYWILKPTSSMLLKTTAKVDNMATALQTTANIVEKTTQQQLLILNSLPIQCHDKSDQSKPLQE